MRLVSEASLMAAWKQTATWNKDAHHNFNRYVWHNAERYEGNTNNCSNLSVLVFLDYAQGIGLCVTFRDDETIFVSKAAQAFRLNGKPRFDSGNDCYQWGDSAQRFRESIFKYITSYSLMDHNTEVNRGGPNYGDLMIKYGHAAVVYRTYPTGRIHPKAHDGSYAVFPGQTQAAQETNQTRYIRKDSDPRFVHDVHFDYLNHRGEGRPTKNKAELIINASAHEMKKEGFQFRIYSKSVTNDWKNWDGTGSIPA
jgi:hypothetical protein